MSKIRKTIDFIFAEDEYLTLENRLFLSAIIVGILTSTFGALVNFIFLTSIIAIIIPLLLSGFLLILYYLVRFKRIIEPVKVPIILLAQIGISIIWVKNGGINGSNVMPGLVILILTLVIVSNKNKKYILILFLILNCIIYLIQLYKPELITNYTSETERWIDSIITLGYSSFFIFLIIKFLHRNYTLERQKSEEGEKKYRLSEANLIEAQKIAHIGSWEWDMASNGMIWSKEMYRVFDIREDEFDGKPSSLLKSIHPNDIELFANSMNSNLPYGISTSIEYRVIHKDGTIHNVFAESRVECNIDGIPFRSVGTVQDITHLKLVEKEKRKADNWLRTLSEAIEQSPVTTVITDLSGNIEFVNPKFTDTTGYTFDEAIGKNPRILKTDKKTVSEYKELWDTILSGKSWQGVFQNKRKNGEIYWESAIISPVKDEDGAIAHFLAVKEEITGRIKAELAILESKDRYKTLSRQLEAILDHIPAMVYYKDTKNNFIRVNKYLAQQHGVEKIFLEGKSLFELYPAVDAEKYYQDDLSVISSGIAKLNIEEIWETESGEKWVNTSKIPFIDDTGKIIGVIGISMDISERKQFEKEIISNNKMLEKLITEKDKFFSIIAHDLRTPFATLVGLSEFMSNENSQFSNEEYHQYSLSLHKTAISSFKLLENLLQWAQLQRGSLPFQPKTIDLNDFFENCDESIIEMAHKKSIQLDISFLPQGLMIIADYNMLRSILRNLITNSIKFTNSGGNINVKAQKDKSGDVLFSVQDTGIGMNTDLINNLFKIDKNVSRQGTEGEPSTGLGLILCKDFIEKHGGKIWAESEVGKGSTFYFTIPYMSDSNLPLEFAQ